MPSKRNRYDVEADLLAKEIRQRRDSLADRIAGGTVPPGTQPRSHKDQLEEYLLIALPIDMLSPEDQQRANDLWQSRFQGRPREEIAEYCWEMEKLRRRYATPELAEPQPPAVEQAAEQDLLQYLHWDAGQEGAVSREEAEAGYNRAMGGE